MKKLSLVLSAAALGLTAVVFQNCSKANFAPTSLAANSSGKLIENRGAGSLYSQVYHHMYLDKSGADPTGMQLQISMHDGRMSLNLTHGYGHAILQKTYRSCDVDSERLSRLNSMLAHAQICNMADSLPPGTVSCQAIAESDIQLVNKDLKPAEVFLRPDMCHNGIVLCENDDVLRSVLKSLIENPPKGCEATADAL